MPLRRLLPALLALLALACVAQAEVAGNEIAIEGWRIRESMREEFPFSVEALGGLATVTACDPVLDFPAQGERLRMQFHASAESAFTGAIPLGRVFLSGGLRYDKRTRGFHLDAAAIERVVPDQPGVRIDANGRELLTALLQEFARTEPLYRLDPKLLATFGNLQVESARIEDGRVIVAFDQPIVLELPDEE